MKRIVIFASGSGSNAENIAGYFSKSDTARVTGIWCNNPKAGVIDRAARLGIPCHVFDRKAFYETGDVLHALEQEQPDLIVLAGFLWLVPENMIHAFPRRIVNIHPALLPGPGGKGMYGQKVHEAVISGGATESGITIHFVNERFDEGEIIFRATCPVDAQDTPGRLAEKVHALEYRHYPEVIDRLLGGDGRS
jgi:phosphoribosylglycinamide formyltransferase-1